jgi:hypothetical protein
MKNIIILFLGLTCGLALKAQTGVNTKTPASSSIAEIKASNKGLLIPRLNITNQKDKAPVTATTIADGLLAFNIGNAFQHTLASWNTTTNSWYYSLYFKQTPKVAVFKMKADKPVLDNAGGGGSSGFTEASNPFEMVNSGYIPGIGFKKTTDGVWGVTVGEGTYIYEVSFLLNATETPNSTYTDGTSTSYIIQNNYYNMGYFSDLFYYPYTASTDGPTGGTGTRIKIQRVEGATISRMNEQHRVRFIQSFKVSGSGQAFVLTPYIGRRSGSSFNDKVTLLAEGTIFKITKLQ